MAISSEPNGDTESQQNDSARTDKASVANQPSLDAELCTTILDVHDSPHTLHEPLLERGSSSFSIHVAEFVETDEVTSSSFAVFQELYLQAKLAAPLSVNLILNYMLPIITMSFAGSISTQVLAAVTLGNTCAKMFGQFLLMGFLGALDTQASQAYGSGLTSSLSVIFQRSVLFLWLHAIPLSILFLFTGSGLQWAGYDPHFCSLVQHFLYGAIPMLWLETINRPLNRILVAQRITSIQLWVAVITVLLHIPWNILFMRLLRLGSFGAALCFSSSSAVSVITTVAIVAALNKQDTVWGKPTKQALKNLIPFAKLAYPSAIMLCMESWAFSGCMILAGFLPQPDLNVAALGASMAVYGFLYMAYVACSMAVSTRVGNALGGGDAIGARRSALVCVLHVPLMWSGIAVITMVPQCARRVAHMFGGSKDPALLELMQKLLFVVGALQLLDGIQTNLAGVVQGLGKQSRAVYINMLSYYCFAIPLAVTLGFYFQLGSQGLLLGLMAGPACQAVCYSLLLAQLDWDKEARIAHQRVTTHI